MIKDDLNGIERFGRFGDRLKRFIFLGVFMINRL